MNDDKREVVKAWFRKAENDLINAEHTMKMKNPPYDTVCFHAQQCAEKYLKGFLTFHEIEFPKTHSIEDLAYQPDLICKQTMDGLELDRQDIRFLSNIPEPRTFNIEHSTSNVEL